MGWAAAGRAGEEQVHQRCRAVARPRGHGAACLLAACLLAAAPAGAAQIPVDSYDLLDSPLTGFGGWAHTYDGSITTIGVSFLNAGFSSSLANYSGGSGTLNDGVVGTSELDTHLFVQGPATDGTEIDPVITLDLGGSFEITTIEILGGADSFWLIPGRIGELTVEIAGIPLVYATTPTGDAMLAWSGFQDDLITIGGAHAGLATSTIALSAFGSGSEDSVGANLYNNMFSITEIRISGQLATAPEPSTGLLISIGLAVLALRVSSQRDRRQRS